MDLNYRIKQLEIALDELHKSKDVTKAAYTTLNFAIDQVKLFAIPVVSGSLCGSARATELVTGCTVYMSGSSGCVGYGNIQCVSGVCEPLGEVSLYGHNQSYKIYDINQIVSYPIAEL